MLRILIFIFFINYYGGYAQTSSEVLIDSLSLTQDKLKKIELCITIAVELEDSDLEKAVEYLDFAKGEALYTEQSDFNLFEIERTKIKSESKLLEGKATIVVESKLLDRIGDAMDVTLKVNGKQFAKKLRNAYQELCLYPLLLMLPLILELT